eukprot:1626556-Pyramimonas_sp.AAC.1
MAEHFLGVTEPAVRSRSPRPQAAARVPSRAPARQPRRNPEARASSSPAELRTATPAPELERPKGPR